MFSYWPLVVQILFFLESCSDFSGRRQPGCKYSLRQSPSRKITVNTSPSCSVLCYMRNVRAQPRMSVLGMNRCPRIAEG
ncbi:unnamed protein product [Pleuronectes platessa]|uniref:Secreted protein n=1 Tax=Pleuronectes platessa TaxID=8262 RepID=A0A9N7YG65_PLEPL|nr:unnamed protein product [Pleuronectes platessa]